LVAQLALFGQGSHARDELIAAYGAGPAVAAVPGT